MQNKEIQDIQEMEYELPYHYLTSFEKNNFSLHKFLYWGVIYQSYMDFIKNESKKINWERGIDIGCGDGRLIHDLAKVFPNKFLKGIDYSAQAIGLAKALNPNNNFEIVDSTTEGITNEQFDIGFSTEVLEHIPPEHIEKAVKNWANLIKKGGHLLLTTPSDEFPVNRKHFQHFNKEKIQKIFEKYFEIIEFKYLNQNTKLSWFLQRLLVNKFFVLNFQPCINLIYKIYIKKCLPASKGNGDRVFVHFRKM